MRWFLFSMLCACVHRPAAPTAQLCHTIQALPGPEDLVEDASRSRVVGTWADRRGPQPGPAGFFAFDGLRVRSLPIRATEELQPVAPHGLDRLEKTDQFFVVDHQSLSRHRILRLSPHGEGLVVEASFSTALMSSANDVAAVSSDEFYVTVDLGARHTIGRLWEVATSRPWGGVLHYRRGRWRWVAKRIAFANGIVLGAKGRQLFVTAYRSGEILRFQRDLATGDLGPAEVLARIPGHPDNLSWSYDGADLIVASQDRFWPFVAHMRDAENHVPGAIYRVTQSGVVTPLFRDDGRRVDAPSIALSRPGHLLIGQVLDDELLLCAQGRSP